MWCSWSTSWASCATRTRRDEGLQVLPLEGHPPHFYVERSRAVTRHMKRVSAAEIDGRGGGCIHNKLSGRRPDERVNRAVIECQPLFVVRGTQDLQS